MFFCYYQNNSGGSFDYNENLAGVVCIEAASACEANSKAETIGIYFEGVWTGRDCDCCGDRWTAAENGHSEPLYYDEPVKTAIPYGLALDFRIHYSDGRIERGTVGQDREPK